MSSRLNNVVFIVGSYRSGTTLLRLMLSQHTLIHIPPETECLPKLLVKYDEVVLSRCSKEEMDVYLAFKKACLKQGWTRFPEFDEVNNFLNESFSIGQLYLAILMSDANQKEKGHVQWVGDNTPAYILSLGLLAGAFPKAKFIHVVRDVRDIMVSVSSASFKSCFNIDSCVLEWEERILQGLSAEKWLESGRLLTIKYEDLVSDPVTKLKDVSHFLGVDYEPRMLAYYQSCDAAEIAKQSHHTNTIRKVSTESVGRYKAELNSQDIDRITSLAYGSLRAFGYEVACKKALPRKNCYKYKSFALNYMMLVFSRGWGTLKQHIIRVAWK